MCPDKQWHSYILPENSKPQYFENMYFVENENMFKSCNATSRSNSLVCLFNFFESKLYRKKLQNNKSHTNKENMYNF